MPGLRHLALRLNDRIMDPSWVDHLLRAKQLTSFDLSSEAAGFTCLTRARGCTTIVGSLHEIDLDERVREVQRHIRKQLGIGGNDAFSAHEGFWFSVSGGVEQFYMPGVGSRGLHRETRSGAQQSRRQWLRGKWRERGME